MIRSFVLVLATLPACMVGYGSDEGNANGDVTGNGSLSGAHYNLNIIGMAQGKTANMTSGGRIFVELTGTTKIMLDEGDFAVIDANGTDGTAAFQLPSPDPTGSGSTTYSVYARALGTPGGSSVTTTCATDPTTGEVVCSTDSMVLVRDGGTSKFTNVSKDLLYITAVIDGRTQTVPLFDSRLQDFFWSYDNNGLRIAQLRFYMNTK
ncbi:MAG: hypothetical protein ACM31C_29285 [Acidobacteriota bacterium]